MLPIIKVINIMLFYTLSGVKLYFLYSMMSALSIPSGAGIVTCNNLFLYTNLAIIMRILRVVVNRNPYNIICIDVLLKFTDCDIGVQECLKNHDIRRLQT